MTTAPMRCRHISMPIARPYSDVSAFLMKPENFPRWASGLGEAFDRVSDLEWAANGPLGRIAIRFTPANPHGVLDHEVTLPDGLRVLNPMRVLVNGCCSEVVFTLFQRPGMPDALFTRDVAWVRRDLTTLKLLLESDDAEIKRR